MKCYVIKNKEGKYLSIASQNYEHYWTTLDFAYYFRFLPNVDAKELADDFKNSRYPDCEVVEITIAEGDLEKDFVSKNYHDVVVENYKIALNDFGNEQTVNENLLQQLAEMTEKYNACQEARKLEAEFNSQDKKELKQQLAEKDNEIEALEEETKMLESWKETYYENWQKAKKELEEMRFRERNLGGLIEKVSSKGQQEIRHQVCEEIREFIKPVRCSTDEYGEDIVWAQDLREFLEQVEKGK